jgi:hypothetical protein
MKVVAIYVAFVFACFGTTPLFAQQLDSWLSNVKREVSRLGINERGYLHSVNRLRNSVFQDESLFFVSSMLVEELDIQLFPDGSVRVLKGGIYSGRDQSEDGTREGGAKKCESNFGEQPRLSLASSRTTIQWSVSDVKTSKVNALAYVDRFIRDVILGEKNIAISPFYNDQSRYQNLIRGSHFEESKHNVRYSLEYIELGDTQSTPGLSSRGSFDMAPKGHLLKLSLMIVDDGVTRKEVVYNYPLLDIDLESFVTGTKTENAGMFLREVAGEVKDFVLSAHCVVTHSNRVVASKGKLLLESGIDAGLSVGDEFLILPESRYFEKRGLLAGVDRIAIVQISEISALSSVLELKVGSVDLEEGAEYFARPLLELI